MPAKKRRPRLQTARVKPFFSAEVTIPYLLEARKFVPRRKIHRRRIVPKVPVGDRIPDEHPSPALTLEQPVSLAELRETGAAARRAATDNLTLVRNVQLDDVATQDTASHVCEPSLATNGQVVFYTGNWFASVSLDGGASFLFVDPASSFPDPPGMEFCCDQIVHYIRKIDTFVWLLQYSEDDRGENVQRLAFATTTEIKQGHWRTFDISSQSLGLPGVFLDYPDLAVGANMLYLTLNGFRGSDWEVTVMVRLPLAGIKSRRVTAQKATSRDNFNFRVAQHCGTTAFWAAHQDTSTLRVYSWKESEAAPTFRDVTVATWAEDGTYVSRTPDNRNWLKRADSRLTGATKVGNELWFAWGSNQGGANQRPKPFAQIARLNARTFQVIENLNLWDPESGICYPALTTNANREVGISYTIGGGNRFPTHVVGILTGMRKEVTTFASVRGPRDQEWGDYLTVRRHYPGGKLFAATGYTLQSGAGLADATPNFTLFGRAGDAI